MKRPILIALGANLAFDNNMLKESLRHAASSLIEYQNNCFIAASGLYETAPVGCNGRQPRYLNAVIAIGGSLSLVKFLCACKRIERSRGRRQRGLNAARPVDIDLIDFGGRVIGHRALRPVRRSYGPDAGRGRALHRRQKREPRRWLTLPHPEMHKRLFVLLPLIEVAPGWMHPVLCIPARQLAARLPKPPGQIRRVLDSKWLSCEKPCASDKAASLLP